MVCAWTSEWGTGGGQASLYNLKILAKKDCFLSLEWEKTNFTTFALSRNILEKSPSASPEKTPSDIHGSYIVIKNCSAPLFMKVTYLAASNFNTSFHSLTRLWNVVQANA